ncbi:MAG: beta galactosidase jelly roll domain-containing protein [Bacteroidia bacterium]|nr:beta galactosidase jelly roll domain-containing protein [Bacteroidia bacterium]
MKTIRIIAALFFMLLITTAVQADVEKLIDLSGQWAFTIGDKTAWASPYYDDSNWDRVKVPEQWENEGFEGYDGFAWYRKSFFSNELPTGQDLYLSLGEIDDADEVFLNGVMIGSSGSFPPHFSTAYNSKRWYLIPRELINTSGKNVIAVRVYDHYYEGGILRGDIGIYGKKGLHKEFFDLQGLWDFRKLQKDESCLVNDGVDWDKLMVPGFWENQGYKHYNGFACYRKDFRCPEELTKEQMVLTLGLIDDMDVVYLNGVRIGSTGIKEDGSIPDPGNSWAYKQLRGYFIPPNLLLPNQVNVLTVKVYDHKGEGGIYEGPIGIIPAKHFTSFLKNIALE